MAKFDSIDKIVEVEVDSNIKKLQKKMTKKRMLSKPLRQLESIKINIYLVFWIHLKNRATESLFPVILHVLL